MRLPSRSGSLIYSCYVFLAKCLTSTHIYTSLHDALPIFGHDGGESEMPEDGVNDVGVSRDPARDRKSTRLNSSHANISYAVFCLKKKNKHVIDAEGQHSQGESPRLGGQRSQQWREIYS